MLAATRLLREREGAAEGGFKLNVARVPLARARAYAERVFAKEGKKLDDVIPDFDANYAKLQRALKQALNIPRSDMPVIEPTDIARFQRDLASGHIDLFKPHFKGRIGMLKGKQTPMAKDKADAFLTGGVKDGNKTDDVVKVALTGTNAGKLLPIQSEVWLEKLVGNIAKYGLPNSGSPVLKATLIISADNRIIDGHHRWGQASLADPGLRMKTLRVPFKIKNLLDLARTYGSAIGRTYKESTMSDQMNGLLAEMRGDRPMLLEAKLSKKKLEAWLTAQGQTKMPNYEAYGKKVHAYVRVPSGMSRKEFEAKLASELGAKPNPGWTRGDQSATEITNISYFKAWHWDESVGTFSTPRVEEAKRESHQLREPELFEGKPNYGRLERLVNSAEKQSREMRHSLDLLKKNPGKNAPQAENLKSAARTITKSMEVLLRSL